MGKALIIILLNAVLTFSGMMLYDKLIITPKISASLPVVVDTERIFRISESKVKSNEISLNVYRDRIRMAETLISEYEMVVNKNVRSGDDLRPIAFGGRDVTDEILERMEALR